METMITVGYCSMFWVGLGPACHGTDRFQTSSSIFMVKVRVGERITDFGVLARHSCETNIFLKHLKLGSAGGIGGN